MKMNYEDDDKNTAPREQPIRDGATIDKSHRYFDFWMNDTDVYEQGLYEHEPKKPLTNNDIADKLDVMMDCIVNINVRINAKMKEWYDEMENLVYILIGGMFMEHLIFKIAEEEPPSNIEEEAE